MPDTALILSDCNYSASVSLTVDSQADFPRSFKCAGFLDIEADVGSKRVGSEQVRSKVLGKCFNETILAGRGVVGDAGTDSSVIQRLLDVIRFAGSTGVGAQFAADDEGLLRRAFMGQNADDGSYPYCMDVDDVLHSHRVMNGFF